MPRPLDGLLVLLGALVGCEGHAPLPPARPPIALTLESEHLRRGEPAGPSVADTDRPEGRIRAAILRDRGDFQACFERILPANPEAAGRLDLSFTVETTGLLTNVAGEAEAAALRPLRECVLRLVRRARVEGIRQPVAVRFPIEFENPPLEVFASEVTITPASRFASELSAATAVGAGSGDLSAEEAQAVVAPQLRTVHACYTALLSRARRAEGTMRFELMVGPDGVLGDVPTAQASEPLQPARDCVLTVLRGLQFRASGRRTVITYRFAMRPREPHPGR